jgi:hypothetical protein
LEIKKSSKINKADRPEYHLSADRACRSMVFSLPEVKKQAYDNII